MFFGPHRTGQNTTAQSQKAVSAYFTSEQILLFGFAEQSRADADHMPHTPSLPGKDPELNGSIHFLVRLLGWASPQFWWLRLDWSQQSQKAVTAYFSSEQLLPLGFASIAGSRQAQLSRQSLYLVHAVRLIDAGLLLGQLCRRWPNI